MPRPSPLTYLPLLTRARGAEIGIRFKVGGVRREYFRNTLYECRKAAENPKFDQLIVFLPGAPHDDEIWVCNKEVELDP
jgi:hypothetical protein